MYHSDIKHLKNRKLTSNGYLFSVTIIDMMDRPSNVVFITDQINQLYKFVDYIVKKGVWHSEIKVTILNLMTEKPSIMGHIDTETQTALIYD